MDQFEKNFRKQLHNFTIKDIVFPPYFYRKAKSKRGIHELDIAKILEEDKIIKIEQGHSNRIIIYVKYSPHQAVKAILSIEEQKIIVITSYKTLIRQLPH